MGKLDVFSVFHSARVPGQWGCGLKCVFCLYLPHTEYQTPHSTSKVRTLMGHEDILAGPHHFNGLDRLMNKTWL